jgi:uncharacterized protein YndB with AHSA1/START domain
MERRHVSRASITIDAASAEVWKALVDPGAAKQYFFGADVRSDWTVGGPITFMGEFNGNAYHEKGVILRCEPERLLEYTHWSDLERLPDRPEHYRNWTFRIEPASAGVLLSVAEDNIPDEAKRARSDEFWPGVLTTIKTLVESGRRSG